MTDDGSLRIYYSKTDDANLYSAISDDGLTFIKDEGFRVKADTKPLSFAT